MKLPHLVTAKTALVLLRLSLGFSFAWFGLLKLFDVSPVTDLIRASVPLFVTSLPFFFLSLSLVEIAIGVAFIANKYLRPAILLMLAHLTVTTLAVLFTQGFTPTFPVLSFPGEFVIKNLVLMAAGLLLYSHEKA